jgi:hypothetical protein
MATHDIDPKSLLAFWKSNYEAVLAFNRENKDGEMKPAGFEISAKTYEALAGLGYMCEDQQAEAIRLVESGEVESLPKRVRKVIERVAEQEECEA